MSGVCGIISSGFVLDCDTPIISGVEDNVLLANFSDIEQITRSTANPTLVTNILMKAGKQFYEVQGRNESAEPIYNLVVARYVKTYDHQITIKFFDNKAVSKQLVDLLKDSCLVALIKGKDGVWEVYGARIGMRQTEGTRNPLDADSGGAHSVIIKTPENAAREPHVPAELLLSDALTTEDFVESLQTLQLVEDPANLLPDVSSGVAYNQTVQILGGTSPYTFETVPGNPLPTPLVLASNGAITGTTSVAAGDYPVIIKVTDSATPTANVSYITITLTVV